MKKYKVKLIETYAFYFEVEANNRVEAEEKAKEYVDKYQADKFFECATNRVFKIIPKTSGKTKVQETFLTVKREAAESSDALYLKKELLKNIQDVLTYGK